MIEVFGWIICVDLPIGGYLFWIYLLQEEQRLLGYHFRSNTDTEVVLCAYIEWGEICLDKLMGCGICI